ncbi:hypothetical protein V4T45_004159 [Vibrio vulnificus]|nr:hypothetical protein [Vibrio vulnificus]ELR8772780.1 hypothetical protein [Vibrio vulnificus]
MEQNPTPPFERALLRDKEIKRALILKQVEDICTEAGLITLLDISTNSKQYQWVVNIIDDHLTGSGLLKSLMFKHAEPNDHCELFKSIVHDIVERLMSHQQPFPRRH